MIQFQTCKPVFWVGWDCRKGTFQLKISPAQQISVQSILSTAPFLWETTEMRTSFGQKSSTYISESGSYKLVQHCKLCPDGLSVVAQGISSCTAHELGLVTLNRRALASMALPRLCHSCLLNQRWLKIKAPTPSLWTKTYLHGRRKYFIFLMLLQKNGGGKKFQYRRTKHQD